jgi:hypothetical protein
MRLAVLALLAVSVGTAFGANLADTEKLLARIKAVSKEGAGNQEAGAAWKELIGQGSDAILPTLTAMDDATPFAANWLRSAITALAEKEKAAGRKLPAEQLEAFLKDTKHLPAARRIAYELVFDADPKVADRLLPMFLNDTSGEMRRDAIAAAVAKAEKLTGDEAKAEYVRLFAFVRDEDQAKKIATTLDKLDARPDFKKHFGLVTEWKLAGPFDSTKGAGFDKAYEPEKKVDLAAVYKGKGDVEVKWTPYTAPVNPKDVEVEKVGMVDLNKALAKHKDSAAYAFTVVESESDRPIEVRFSCICAIKVFLNGKQLYAREEYHHGQRFDQYVAPATLKAGKNEILVKVCQNNQTDPWAQLWQFQLRISDATGGAVPFKTVLAAKLWPQRAEAATVFGVRRLVTALGFLEVGQRPSID